MSESILPLAKPGVVLREEFDDWAVLFDPETGDAFGLNPVSVFVWKHLDGNTGMDELLAGLKEACDEVPENGARQVQEFLDELLEKGLAGHESRER